MSENRELKKIIAEENKVLKGSAYLSKKSVKKIDREAFMYENMSQNLSFIEAKKMKRLPQNFIK